MSFLLSCQEKRKLTYHTHTHTQREREREELPNTKIRYAVNYSAKKKSYAVNHDKKMVKL